jgi:hypothetical protein
VVDGPAAADGSGASDGPARVDGGPLADAEAGIAPTLITCAKLAAMQTLNAGQNYLLDLTGAPPCQLGANTDLVIGGAGTQLTVENGTLEVQGNITLSGNGAFRVSNGTLQIDNQSSFQRNISAGDSSSLVIDHSTVVTNATGMNNFGTNLNASGTASAQFLYSTLPSTNSWLLGVMADSSTLVSQNSTTPNEIYVHDSSNVDIEDDQVPSHPRARMDSGSTFRVEPRPRSLCLIRRRPIRGSWEQGKQDTRTSSGLFISPPPNPVLESNRTRVLPCRSRGRGR